MSPVSSDNFGLLIAYLIPGFLALCGISPHSELIETWLGATAENPPTIGGFLYVTVASVAAGITVSTVRWLVLDYVHHRSGLSPPALSPTDLQANIDAFKSAVEYHYRYYQFYGNTLVALVVLLVGRFPAWNTAVDRLRWTTMIALVFLGALFFKASRDALKKYYTRIGTLQHEIPTDKESTDD